MDVRFIKDALTGHLDGFEISQPMNKEEFKRHCYEGIRRMEEKGDIIELRCIEELCELGQKISKISRSDKDNFDDCRIALMEEIADSLWVVGILMNIYEIDEQDLIDMVRLKEFVQE